MDLTRNAQIHRETIETTSREFVFNVERDARAKVKRVSEVPYARGNDTDVTMHSIFLELVLMSRIFIPDGLVATALQDDTISLGKKSSGLFQLAAFGGVDSHHLFLLTHSRLKIPSESFPCS